LASSNDLWKYHIASNTWTLLRADGAAGNPTSRFTYFGAPTRKNGHDLFVIVSGETFTEAGDFHLNSSWTYNVEGDAFHDVTPHNPAHNLFHGVGLSSAVSAGIMTDPHVYPLYGGEGEGGETGCGAPFTTNPQNQTWILDIETFQYSQLFPTGDLPPALKRNAGDVVDNFFYVSGGYSFSCVDNVGGQVWFDGVVWRLKLKEDGLDD